MNEILYLPNNNKLYLFADEYQKIFTFNLTSGKIDKEINFTNIAYTSSLIYPRRNAFFSEDNSSCHFLCKENLNSPEQIWTFSIAMDSIVQKTSLSEYNFSNEDGYNLQYGIRGNGLIEGYITNSQSQDYSILNLSNGTKSNPINYIGWTQALFINDGNYIVILPEIDTDTLTYLSGTFKFYNYVSTQLLKTINLPAGGKILTSNNYPNNIYYIKDIELPTRQIYTLKMDSIFNVLDLTSLDPSSVIVNSPPFTLTVNGYGFDSLSTVYFNETAKTTTFVSDSVLTAEISTSDISVVGNYSVWVTDEWGTSDTLTFEVIPHPPVLNSITPALAFPTGPFVLGYDFTVTAAGEYFTDSSVVYYNGQAKATTYISDSVITFPVNSHNISFAGNYPVWVSNYDSNSDTLYFSVVETLPQPVTPVFNCIRNNGDRTFTAFFGYNNQNTGGVYIDYGDKNKFSPGSINRGQPTVFLPGIHSNVFSIDYDGDNLTWTLDGTSITVNKNSTQCP